MSTVALLHGASSLSGSGLLVDLVVDFRKRSESLELLPGLFIQRVVKHLPELVSGHVGVGVHHLEAEK